MLIPTDSFSSLFFWIFAILLCFLFFSLSGWTRETFRNWSVVFAWFLYSREVQYEEAVRVENLHVLYVASLGTWVGLLIGHFYLLSSVQRQGIGLALFSEMLQVTSVIWLPSCIWNSVCVCLTVQYNLCAQFSHLVLIRSPPLNGFFQPFCWKLEKKSPDMLGYDRPSLKVFPRVLHNVFLVQRVCYNAHFFLALSALTFLEKTLWALTLRLSGDGQVEKVWVGTAGGVGSLKW